MGNHPISISWINHGRASRTRFTSQASFLHKKMLRTGFRFTGTFNNSEPNNLWFLIPCTEFCFPLLTYRSSYEQVPLINYRKSYKQVPTNILVKKAIVSQEKHLRKLSQDEDRLCGLEVRVSGYRYRGLGFDSRRYQIFWVVVGLERGPLSLVRSIEELLE